MIDPKNHTVLIVDDEEHIRNILSEDLEDEGFQTLTASSGNKALEIVRNSKVDIIVSDIRMDDGNGVQLLDAVKEIDPGRPVLLFITAFADISIPDAYDKGADGIFTKPVKSAHLIKSITNALTPRKEYWLRKHDRIETNLKVELSFDSFKDARLACAINLGRGGMFFKYEDKLPKLGDCLKFKILFKDDEFSPTDGSGVVRWVRETSSDMLPRGFGVEFDYLNDFTVESVLTLLNSLKTKAFIPKGC